VWIVAGRSLRAVAATARGGAEILLTAGVVVLLFAVYLVFWSDVRTAAAQEVLQAEFEEQTEQTLATPSKSPEAVKPPKYRRGDAIALMRIPRLGSDWEWIVVEGVATEQIDKGPGHFPGTAFPGEIGNFAVAGHRATHGEPFAYLDKLVPGDRVFVQSITGWSIYEVTRSHLVSPSAVEVIDPVPGQPNGIATSALITLVTCHPRWGSSERLVVEGILVNQRTLEQGPPKEFVN
jgi:sortase A